MKFYLQRLCVLGLFITTTVHAQDSYESANNSSDQVNWTDVDWQDPFNADPALNNTATAPGSLLNGGATDDIAITPLELTTTGFGALAQRIR